MHLGIIIEHSFTKFNSNPAKHSRQPSSLHLEQNQEQPTGYGNGYITPFLSNF